jgi:hypothetical protein
MTVSQVRRPHEAMECIVGGTVTGLVSCDLGRCACRKSLYVAYAVRCCRAGVLQLVWLWRMQFLYHCEENDLSIKRQSATYCLWARQGQVAVVLDCVSICHQLNDHQLNNHQQAPTHKDLALVLFPCGGYEFGLMIRREQIVHPRSIS